MAAVWKRAWHGMLASRDINLRREIATALAVLAMALQVIFAPILIERHSYTVETDFGLTVLCGSSALDHADPASAGDPSAPTSDHQSHDCPCCSATGGHAVLPEPAIAALPPPLFAPIERSGPVEPQVATVATISDTQLPRAPPTAG